VITSLICDTGDWRGLEQSVKAVARYLFMHLLLARRLTNLLHFAQSEPVGSFCYSSETSDLTETALAGGDLPFPLIFIINGNLYCAVLLVFELC
jgi:hypothetical protein